MTSKHVSRRAFLNDAALMALAVCLAGCTKSVTKYRPDGTPYTVQEDDPVATLAGVVLLLLLLAAAAASKSNKSSMNHHKDGRGSREEDGKVHLASSTSRWRHLEDVGPEVSVTDSKGRLLASVDSFEQVRHHDLAAAECLLADARISNVDQPVTFHLQHDRSDTYRVKEVRVLNKPSREKSTVLVRRIGGKLYEVGIRTIGDGRVDVEIASGAHCTVEVA